MRYAGDIEHRDVSLTALDGTHIVGMKVGQFRQLLLSQFSAQPQLPHTRPKGQLDFLLDRFLGRLSHAGSFPVHTL